MSLSLMAFGPALLDKRIRKCSMRDLGEAGSMPGATSVLILPGFPGSGECTALCKGIVVQKRGIVEGLASG